MFQLVRFDAPVIEDGFTIDNGPATAVLADVVLADPSLAVHAPANRRGVEAAMGALGLRVVGLWRPEVGLGWRLADGGYVAQVAS